MRIFVRIVDTSSFTRAAESLEVPRATAATAVQPLEPLLGVQLLVRTARKVTLTAEGAAYHELCAQILAAAFGFCSIFALPQKLTGGFFAQLFSSRKRSPQKPARSFTKSAPDAQKYAA
ncbi:LysR family transcriptional regulator [Paraburkholderia phytofirmans]|uniref:LysR family transcriptional regulator n=1 Tax=Paraburkholderia phytofirmans TaxID=261302 RepID=A0ABW9BM94_9BURK